MPAPARHRAVTAPPASHSDTELLAHQSNTEYQSAPREADTEDDEPKKKKQKKQPFATSNAKNGPTTMPS